MHYYQFNIADYRKDTSHLSLLEHAIYRLLLDTYYLNEEPLTRDKKKLMRTHCVRNAEEVRAFENVLNDYFEETEDGYFHGKCAEELEKIYEKSAKAKASAEARWNKKNNKNKGIKKEECGKDANALRTDSEGNANGMLPNTQYPIPNNNTPPKNSKKKTAVMLKTYIADLKSQGEPPFRDDDPIYDYAKDSKIPLEFIEICWAEFQGRYFEEKKKYKDWRSVFRKCVRGNWFKLWWFNNATGSYELTTPGVQARNTMRKTG